jgi:uncharacterized coiled-coil protein SlyX
MQNGNKVAIVLGIVCLFLSVYIIAYPYLVVESKPNSIASLTSTIEDLTDRINSQNEQLAKDNSTIASLNAAIEQLQNQSSHSPATPQPTPPPNDNAALNAQISSLQSQVSAQQNTIESLNNQIANLTDILNSQNSQKTTLVYHVAEKGEAWSNLPNATDTYNQILALDNNAHDIVFLPEYMGNVNWSDTLAWLSANFGGQYGIPIMLEVFGGGNESTPTPMLTSDQILDAMAVSNVQSVRICEVVSWHMEANQTFPADYLLGLLSFCRANNLTVFWTEWKNESFPLIQEYISGYEDIVTVSFSTNSQDFQPTAGFLLLKDSFQNWGASVQAWYWVTYQNQDLMDMPPSLLLEHALSANSLGAKVIEFEPFWYFFDNGTPNANAILLEEMLQ